MCRERNTTKSRKIKKTEERTLGTQPGEEAVKDGAFYVQLVGKVPNL